MSEAGKKAPDFCLEDQHGQRVCLNEMKGKRVVMFVYVKDSTPG